MNNTTVRLRSLLIGATLLASISVSTQAGLPQGQFACQVQTVSGKSGLVLVQTDTRAEAERVAASARALIMGGGESKTISVAECIQQPNEKFKDTWFNKFYENSPQ